MRKRVVPELIESVTDRRKAVEKISNQFEGRFG